MTRRARLRSIPRTFALLALAFALVLVANGAFAQAPAPAAPADKPADAAKPADKPAEAPKPAAPTSLTLKAGDASIKFGMLLQAQADWTQDPVSGGYAQNMFLRRIRVNLAGNATKDLYFFIQTDNPSLGKATTSGTTTTKTISSGFQILDAVAEWRIAKEFNLWGGLIYVPTSREALKSSMSEFEMDLSAYAYTATTALAGTGGRDTGFMARGYFLDDRLEYRAGVFQGLRETGSRNAFRFVGRAQYNFFDKEVYNLPAYVGANLGTKKILAIGAAYDAQMDYRGVTADLFADIPTGFGSFVSTVVYQRLDGRKTLPTLLKSDILQLEAGIYVKGSKLGPWGRYEMRTFLGNVVGKDEKRWLVGLNYYMKGHNANLKAGYGRLDPEVGKGVNQFTLQLQAAL